MQEYFNNRKKIYEEISQLKQQLKLKKKEREQIEKEYYNWLTKITNDEARKNMQIKVKENAKLVNSNQPLNMPLSKLDKKELLSMLGDIKKLKKDIYGFGERIKQIGK